MDVSRALICKVRAGSLRPKGSVDRRPASLRIQGWTERMSTDTVDGFGMRRFALPPSPSPAGAGEGSVAPGFEASHPQLLRVAFIGGPRPYG